MKRPRTRADCSDVPRPCPWVGCRHNLYLDVSPAQPRTVRLSHPWREPHEVPPAESCALDLATYHGPLEREDVAHVMGRDGERVRQIEEEALDTMRTRLETRGITIEEIRR